MPTNRKAMSLDRLLTIQRLAKDPEMTPSDMARRLGMREESLRSYMKHHGIVSEYTKLHKKHLAELKKKKPKPTALELKVLAGLSGRWSTAEMNQTLRAAVNRLIKKGFVTPGHTRLGSFVPTRTEAGDTALAEAQVKKARSRTKSRCI